MFGKCNIAGVPIKSFISTLLKSENITYYFYSFDFNIFVVVVVIVVVIIIKRSYCKTFSDDQHIPGSFTVNHDKTKNTKDLNPQIKNTKQSKAKKERKNLTKID